MENLSTHKSIGSYYKEEQLILSPSFLTELGPLEIDLNKKQYLESFICTLTVGDRLDHTKKRRRNNNPATIIFCNSQLGLFPIASKGNGISVSIKIDFSPPLLYESFIASEPLRLTIFKPKKTERSKKKSNSDPFELWQDVIEGEMKWNESEKCFTFTSKELQATTTNNTIYELLAQVKFAKETNSIVIPIGIPSRADQIDEFVDDLIEYHQSKMKELGYSKAEVWVWFEPVIRNSCISYLGIKDEHLNMEAVKQGFERHNGDVISLWKNEIRALRKYLAKESPAILREIAEKGWIHMIDTKTSVSLLSSQFLPELQLLRINGIGNVTIVRKQMNGQVGFYDFHTNEGVWGILSLDHKLLAETLGFNLLLPNSNVLVKEVVIEKLGICKCETKNKYKSNIILQFERLATSN